MGGGDLVDHMNAGGRVLHAAVTSTVGSTPVNWTNMTSFGHFAKYPYTVSAGGKSCAR